MANFPIKTNKLTFLLIGFLSIVIFACSSKSSKDSGENPSEKNIDTAIIENENQVIVSFKSCQCYARFPSYDFQTEGGESISLDDEQLTQLKNQPPFFCDESFGNNRMISPYANKRFLLTFDKPYNSPEKRLLEIKLLDKVTKTYIFASELDDGHKTELKISDFSQSFIHSYSGNKYEESVNFIKNQSTEKNNFDKSMFFITNRDMKKNKVLLNMYNPESDEYETLVLVDSLLH